MMFTINSRRRSGLVLLAASLVWLLPFITTKIVHVAPVVNQNHDDDTGRIHHDDRMLEAGLDPSEALGCEDGGCIYRREDGTPVNYLTIAKELGYQWIRIRIMVDPNGKYGLFQDLSYVLRMARHAKRLNFKILLDFHYSHWWADGDNQWTPDRWRVIIDGKQEENIDLPDMKQAVYNFTKRTMHVLQEENVLPDAVQIGNEISRGMIWGHGKLPTHWDIQSLPPEWYNLKELIQSGINAIDDVVYNAKCKRPLIVIHLDTGGDTEFTEHWIRTYLDDELGGTCDVIGLSWYPMWHGSMQDLQRNIDNLSEKFPEKQVWVVETAYYYEGYCDPEDVECNRKFPYPMTPEGQYEFLRALRKTLLQTKCGAVFYWGSHWSQPNTWFRAAESWADAERRALFDRSGKALKGIRGLVGL